MGDLATRLSTIVGHTNLLTGDAIPEDYAHDEALTTAPQVGQYRRSGRTRRHLVGAGLAEGGHWPKGPGTRRTSDD